MLKIFQRPRFFQIHKGLDKGGVDSVEYGNYFYNNILTKSYCTDVQTRTEKDIKISGKVANNLY